mmetsp:Transcript_25110/g.46559  ORF Transcript_25110/g.46559 Transcript_25110/m.46559 type:complete len:174 (-) Transcript_25110:668-1189(-)
MAMSSLISRRAAAAGLSAARKCAASNTPWSPLVHVPQTVRRRKAAMPHSHITLRFLSAEASDPGAVAETVPITYVDPLGNEHNVDAEIGKNLMDVAHDNNIELEGACGGELACATCHLVFEKSIYDTLPEKLDEEDDMLDLAFELTDTSRLGCQICVREDFAGMKVTIPDDGM